MANPPGQRFCNGCGARLPGAEEPTGPPPDPRRYTPAHIAERITASADALEGERKQVTVLFADVQGSMDLAENVDSETWREVMDRFFELVCAGVHRFEGTVNKFTGDGAMALFGAPLAVEDHARRACYAALALRDDLAEYARELRREHGLAFLVRIGLNSGEVVVGAVGHDLHMDYTAIGHTVGLAARMEALAEPGKPYLTRGTAALIDGYFELEDVGELQVKGVHEPVHAYALLGVGEARTRIDAAAGRGLSRFVGRDAELAALESALEHAARGGQVVGVVAEPGLGKSRLCREFAEHCRARGIQVTEGRGVAHGRRIPLLPVIEMLRDYFRVGDQDDHVTAREKIAGRLLLLDEEFRDALPVLFDFLGVADPDHPVVAQMSPEARSRALFSLIRRLVHARASAGPGVLLVEDLHWLDAGSEAFLANLVESLPGASTLLVVNFRPEYRADWMQKSFYQQIPLVPLGQEAIAELARDLIGDDPSLDGLRELIAERTGGNPFFIEEVVQSLVDRGTLSGRKGAYRLAHSIDQLEIPPTVQAVLAARIDRLPEREKSVLHAAAVIGREFSEPVLRRVTGLPEHELSPALDTLVRVELIFERTLYPEAQYAFRHPLTEEVAYRSQLGERRARTHAAVAKALEEVEVARLDELAGLLSTHWEQARQPLQAAQWGARAATWAGQSHPADALRHWRRVRALLRDLHDTQEAAGLALGACIWILQFGWRLGLGDDEVEGVSREAHALADASGSAWAKAAVSGAHALSRGMTGHVDEALMGSLEARHLAIEAGDLELRSSGGDAYWLALTGRAEEALRRIEETIELARGDYELGRRIVGFSSLIWAVMFRGPTLVTLGRMAEGGRALEEALRLATDHDDPESAGWTHSNFGSLAASTGEPAGSLEHARRGLEVAERLGSPFSRAVACFGITAAHAARGEWAEALAAAERQLAIMRETRTGLQYEPLALAQAAEARLGLGDRAGAREAAAEGVSLSLACSVPPFETRARLMLGRAVALESPVQARAELEHALELARERAIDLIPHVHVGLAELAGSQGREDERLRQLELAFGFFDEHGATGHARTIAAELGTAPRAS